MHITQNKTSRTGDAGPVGASSHLEPRDESISRINGRRRGVGSRDRLLPGHEDPPLGAHLVTSRLAYTHHGVYVGGGLVVHYAAFAKCWRRGPVEEISLTRFAHGHPVWVRRGRRNTLPSAEIVRRARLRVGENRYRFFGNNCEHLSEWCVNGESRSLQVERFLAHLQPLARALRDLWRFLPLVPPRRSAAPHPLH